MAICTARSHQLATLQQRRRKVLLNVPMVGLQTSVQHTASNAHQDGRAQRSPVDTTICAHQACSTTAMALVQSVLEVLSALSESVATEMPVPSVLLEPSPLLTDLNAISASPVSIVLKTLLRVRQEARPSLVNTRSVARQLIQPAQPITSVHTRRQSTAAHSTSTQMQAKVSANLVPMALIAGISLSKRTNW